MPEIRAITVYCSASRHVADLYLQAATELGTRIARERWQLVYGGNTAGCMDALANAARAAGGKVIGVTPQVLVDHGIADPRCDELIVTAGMRERKALLEQRGDAFIALPGGIGTLEEIFEILVGKFLGYHAKPIVLVNLNGFYDPLLAMLEHTIEQGFAKSALLDLFHVAKDVGEGVEMLKGESNVRRR